MIFLVQFGINEHLLIFSKTTKFTIYSKLLSKSGITYPNSLVIQKCIVLRN